VPEDAAKGPLNETQLAQYMEILGGLRERMVQALDAQPDASVNVVARDLQTAVGQVEAMLQTRTRPPRARSCRSCSYAHVGGGIRLSSPM